MVVVMSPDATDEDVAHVVAKVESVGGEAFVSKGVVRTIIGLVGDIESFHGLNLRTLPGVADDAPNQCSVTPCALSMAHTTITFTVRTGKPGHYRWQCFVPCAAGFPNGFGGPMQTVGWMDGYLNVA